MEFLHILQDGTVCTPSSGKKDGFVAILQEQGSLDFLEDSTPYFLITALMVPDHDLEGLEQRLQSIWPQNEEGEDLLYRLEEMDFGLFAIYIDKANIWEESGLRQKHLFQKFLNILLHREFANKFSTLQMIREKGDHVPFLQGFETFIQKRHTPSLFTQPALTFKPLNLPCLSTLGKGLGQMLLRGLGKHKQASKTSREYSLLTRRILGLKEWPDSYEKYLVSAEMQNPREFDSDIASMAIQLAQNFIQTHRLQNSRVIQEQCLFLRFLLLRLRFQNPEEYVPVDHILDNLISLRQGKVDRRYLRSEIVTPLRDQGLILASSPRGYKLPINQRDLQSYVQPHQSLIIPMLRRLQHCRETILQSTRGRVDILGSTEQAPLRKLLEDMEIQKCTTPAATDPLQDEKGS